MLKKDCTLIATIPAMTNMSQVREVINNHFISGYRWNTGVVTPYNEYDTLLRIKNLNETKTFWVDLKGRQLRVTEWGNPLYDCIRVNHNVYVNGPAVVLLRGESKPLNLVKANGNKLYVNPLPSHAVGVGQSINIVGVGDTEVVIDGYLTDSDKRYIDAADKLGIHNFMASFVESKNDVNEIKKFCGDCDVVCKIESKKGVEKLHALDGMTLMAARDDLYNEVGNPYEMYRSLKAIISQDKGAICASRLFTSLEKSSKCSFSDFEDIENMYALGYRNFMLCDNICNFHFSKALMCWERFINEDFNV